MPIVSQARNLDDHHVNYIHMWDGLDEGSGARLIQHGQQWVTSYRSGSRWDDPAEDSVVTASQSGSGWEARRAILRQMQSETPTSQFDRGNEFFTKKRSFDFPEKNTVLNPKFGSPTSLVYTGYIYPVSPFMDYPTEPVDADSDVKSDGSAAMRLAIPTKSEAQLAVFLGEIFNDGLPSLFGLKTAREGVRARTMGHEYLNVEFGWKPFVSDIQKLATAFQNSNRILENFKRDSGRVVRRKRLLYDQTEVTMPVGTGLFGTPAMGSFSRFPGNERANYFSEVGEINTFDFERRTCRFAGAFSYLLTEGDSALSRWKEFEQKANHLLGTRFTEDTFYSLTPWSWLIDWFSNLGTVISNASALANDSLVMRYGYVMHHTVKQRTYTQRLVLHGGQSVALRCDYTWETKRRTRGTPFGFDIDLENLSPRQWTILTALGMTRGDKTLR